MCGILTDFAFNFLLNSTVNPNESLHRQSHGRPEEECIDNFMLTLKNLNKTGQKAVIDQCYNALWQTLTLIFSQILQ